MKLIFGLNIILHVEIIDEQVDYRQDLMMNVHNLKINPGIESDIRSIVFCDFHGKRIHFRDFDQIATMDKRKLLALKKITVILS